MLEVRTCVFVALVVATISANSAEDYVLPAGVTVLTEEQLFNKLIGNTTYNGRWSTYWEPPSENQMGGRYREMHKKYGKNGGSWSIKGHLFCYNPETPPMSAHPGCHTYALNGDTIAQYRVNGTEEYSKWGRLKLVSGNPENL